MSKMCMFKEKQKLFLIFYENHVFKKGLLQRFKEHARKEFNYLQEIQCFVTEAFGLRRILFKNKRNKWRKALYIRLNNCI